MVSLPIQRGIKSLAGGLALMLLPSAFLSGFSTPMSTMADLTSRPSASSPRSTWTFRPYRRIGRSSVPKISLLVLVLLLVFLSGVSALPTSGSGNLEGLSTNCSLVRTPGVSPGAKLTDLSKRINGQTATNQEMYPLIAQSWSIYMPAMMRSANDLEGIMLKWKGERDPFNIQWQRDGPHRKQPVTFSLPKAWSKTMPPTCDLTPVTRALAALGGPSGQISTMFSHRGAPNVCKRSIQDKPYVNTRAQTRKWVVEFVRGPLE